MSPHIPLRLIQEVRDRAREVCEYCLLPQSSQEATFHIDHIVPRREGGDTDAANLALACVTCSLRKGARMFAIDPQTQTTVTLFHPREVTSDCSLIGVEIILAASRAASSGTSTEMTPTMLST